MAREVTDGVYWLNECAPLSGEHVHVSSYLLTDGDANVLVDTGSIRHGDDVVSQTEAVVGDDGIDAIVLSQPDLLHTGNVSAVRSSFDAELICFTGAPELHGYSGVVSAETGTEAEVGGKRFAFIDPIVADVASTSWIYDHDSRGLFTSDAFGHTHAPERCDQVFRPTAHSRRQMYDVTRLMNRWMVYVDPVEVERAIRDVFGEYDVDYVFPVHGSPVVKRDVETYVASFVDVVERIAGEYEYRG